MRNCIRILLAPQLVAGVAVLFAQTSHSSLKLRSDSAAERIQSHRIAGADSVAVQKYDNLPLAFERRAHSEFLARAQNYAVEIRDGRVTLGITGEPVTGLDFVHARGIEAVAEHPLPGKINYILGPDPRHWRLALPTYERVRFPDLYPGVDVIFYGNQHQLEFDLALKPGADIRSIRMRFTGSHKPYVDAGGNLKIGDLQLAVPAVLQGNTPIDASYRVADNGEVTFHLGTYDPGRALTIDPTLVYATRLGGGTAFDQATSIALDTSGNAYIAGTTYAADFPAVNSAFGGYNANGDGFISKVNSTGTALIYSTYIGGSAYDTFKGIAVDASGSAWAVGNSSSTDFPLLSAYQNTLSGGTDAIVVKLAPSGTLAYSTFLGTPGYDSANGVAVDPFGNAYVTGQTGAGFPTTQGVYQPSIPGGTAAFVSKFSTSASLLWSTFVGGGSFDYANGIAVDNFGNTYIAGISSSPAFPGAPAGGAQPTNRGGGDAFVAKINFNGSGLLYFTFFGGSSYDQANAIAVDQTSGVAVIAGQTLSSDLPATSGALQANSGGGQDGFVAKLNASGSAFVYATYLGGNRSDFITGITLDAADNAYVIGYTHSKTFPVSAPIQSAIQGNATSLFHTANSGSSWTAFDTTLPAMATAVSADPASAGTLVASTENGVYRTTNNGASWTQVSPIGYMPLSRSPASSSTIYALSGTNAYLSADSGLTWMYRGSISVCCGGDILADPLSASTAYAWASSPFLVQKTVDGGATWSPASNGIPANQNIGKMVAAADGTLYVALRNAVPGQDALGVYRSTDHAATWVAANTGLYPNFPLGNMAASPSNAAAVYLTDFFTLYQTTSNGAWQSMGNLPVSPGCIPSSLGVSAAIPSLVYFAPCYTGFSNASLWVSSNSGGTWSPGAGLGVATINYGTNALTPDPANSAGEYAVANVNWVAVAAKLDATGSSLLYSTYLGDSSFGLGIATDKKGTAYAAGYTNVSFPTTPGAIRPNRLNISDVFVARISDATSACTYAVDPPQTVLPPWLDFAEFVVTAPSGCAWTASSNQPWMTIANGSSGSGSGVVYVRTSTAAATQTAMLTIGGQTVAVQQLGSNCGGNSFMPQASVVPGSGGTLQFSVTASCNWTVVTNDPDAVTITSGSSGTGNGTVTLNVAPNLGPNTRTLTVYSPQGQSETISQAGTTAPAVVATITSTPPGASVTVIGSNCIPGTYATPAKVTWYANTNCTVKFNTPQTIAGSSYTFYSSSINGGPATTTNPLTVNSGTAPPTINATFVAPCSYTLSPSSASISSAGGLGSFSVAAGSTCAWTPVSNVGWITILPGPSSGAGSLSFAVAANTQTVSRVGVITVGGQPFTVTEAGYACSYAISPSYSSAGDAGGNVSVLVGSAAGCPWTARSNASWLTVTSGGAGSGNGTVTVSVAPNTGGQRSGTVTIGSQTLTVSQGAGACGAVDVTSLVLVGQGPFQYWSSEFAAIVYKENVSITNASGKTIPGPINLVLVGLPKVVSSTQQVGFFTLPPGTTLSSCFTPGSPAYVVPVAASLSPSQTVNESFMFVTYGPGISYTPKVLSGTPLQ